MKVAIESTFISYTITMDRIIVTQKDRFDYFIGGIALITGGFVPIFALGMQNDFAVVFAKLAGIVAIIYGVVLLNAYAKTRQPEAITLTLENDTLAFDDQVYPLHPESLLTDTKRYMRYFVVTLYEVRDNRKQMLGNRIVLNKEEFARFKKMLSAYLLHRTEFASQGVTLFEKGFALQGKEFIYDQIERLEGAMVETGAATYIDITLHPKNGPTELFRIAPPIEDQAKALYIIYKTTGKRPYCPKFPKISAALFFIAVATGVWAYLDDKETLMYWMIALGVWMLYRIFVYFDRNALCEKFEAIIESQIT